MKSSISLISATPPMVFSISARQRMKMSKVFGLIVLFSCLSFVGLRAQVEVTYDKGVGEELSGDKREEVAQQLSERIAEYEQLLGEIIDVRQGTVDFDKEDQFRALFSDDAVLFNDLRNLPEKEPLLLDGYLERISDYFKYDGILIIINSAMIKSISINPATRRYTVSVLVNKAIENVYDEEGEVIPVDRSYDLTFNYTFREDEPERAKLRGVLGLSAEFAGNYNTYLGLNVIGGIGSVSQESISGNSNLELSMGLEYGGGAFVMSNFFAPSSAIKKNLFLVGSLDYTVSSLEGEINDFTGERPLDVAGFNGEGEPATIDEDNFLLYAGDNIQASETQNGLGTVRLGVGLGYQIYNKETSSAFISVQYAPSLIVSSDGILTGDGNYFLRTPDNQGLPVWSTNDANGFDEADRAFANAYNLKGQDLNAAPELETQLVHGVLISGMFMKDLVDNNPTYGLGLGVSYYLPFTAAWNNDQQAPSFLDNDGLVDASNEESPRVIDNGIIQNFSQGEKIGSIFLSLKVFLKRTKKP